MSDGIGTLPGSCRGADAGSAGGDQHLPPWYRPPDAQQQASRASAISAGRRNFAFATHSSYFSMSHVLCAAVALAGLTSGAAATAIAPRNIAAYLKRFSLGRVTSIIVDSSRGLV